MSVCFGLIKRPQTPQSLLANHRTPTTTMETPSILVNPRSQQHTHTRLQRTQMKNYIRSATRKTRNYDFKPRSNTCTNKQNETQTDKRRKHKHNETEQTTIKTSSNQIDTKQHPLTTTDKYKLQPPS